MTSRTRRRATAAERDERMRTVLRLRLRAGLSVSEIARALDHEAKGIGRDGVAKFPDAKGPSKRTVIRDLKRGYEAMRSDEPELDDLKTELGGYLAELKRSYLPAAIGSSNTPPDIGAARMVLEILDREAALHGLNAPERIELKQQIIEPDLGDVGSGYDKAPPVTAYRPEEEDKAPPCLCDEGGPCPAHPISEDNPSDPWYHTELEGEK